MPVSATVLGTAITSGYDPEVPITVAQPAGSVVFLVISAFTTATFPLSQGFRAVPTDNAGGTWIFNSPRPFIGNTGIGAAVGGQALFANVFGASRTAGSDLQPGGGGPAPRPGCTTCGSMLTGMAMAAGGGGGGGGSTVTIPLFNTDSPAPQIVLAMVIALEGVQNRVETDDQSQYSNGDTYPGGVSPSAMNWQNDLGLGSVPKPDADCAIYTAASAYGTNGWAPVNGSVLAELQSGSGYLAVSLDAFAAAGVRREPGGNFAGAGTILFGNYQLVRLI